MTINAFDFRTTAYEMQLPEQLAFAYGTPLQISVPCTLGSMPLRDRAGRKIRLGLRLFRGAQKIREYRIDATANEPEDGKVLFEGAIGSDFLRPGAYRLEANLVVDGLGWFSAPPAVATLNLTSSPLFQDVKELLRKYSVEELCKTAEEYFVGFRKSEWMKNKPYSVEDIQHHFPQIGFLVRGLNLKPGMTILDFGAGTGWISRILWRLGMKVISLDVSATALEIGKAILDEEPARSSDGSMSFMVFDGRRLALEDASIDRVLCNSALHHVPNREEVLAELSRVLKPGGRAGFCEPGAEHSLHPRSQDEMRHYKVIENDMPPEILLAEMRQAGFGKVEVMLHNAMPPVFPLQDWLDPARRPALEATALRAMQVRCEQIQILFAERGS